MAKLSESLQTVGHPVAYYPRLARALGGVKQGILLCQLYYYDGKQQHPEGWIYKSADELTEETGLSYKEQTSARGHLKELGILEEHHDRLNHRLYFRIHIDRLNEVYETWQTPPSELPNEQFPNCQKVSSGTDERSVGEPTEGMLANTPKVSSFNRTKTTTKTTTKNVGSGKKIPLPPPQEAINCALKISNHISNIPNAKPIPSTTITRWASDIEKLHRIDGRSWEDINAVLTWALNHSFWSRNIQSGAKFREKWNTLVAQQHTKKPASLSINEQHALWQQEPGVFRLS